MPLAIDGIVGPQTWSRLLPDTIKNGDSGSGVRLLQSILKDFADPNLDPGPIDGIFGPNTEMAVQELPDISGPASERHSRRKNLDVSVELTRTRKFALVGTP